MAFRDKTLVGGASGVPASCRRSAAPVALVLAAALGAAPALAAPSAAGDDPGFAPSGLTSVKPITGRGYSLDGTVSTLYDSNIIRAGDGSVIRPGAVRSDFRFSPAVSGAIALPVGRQQLFIGGLVGRDFYARNTQLDRNRYSVGGGVNLRAGTRCQGTVAGDFSSRQTLLSEFSEFVPNVRETLTYGATASCQSAAGLGFGGTVQRSELRNDSVSRRQFDVNTTAFSPNISYGRPNLGRFSLGGSYAQSTYPRRQVLLPDASFDNDGVDILSGRFGYSRSIGSRFSVAAGVSYLEAKPQPKSVVQFITVPANPPTVPPTTVVAPIIVDRATFSGIGYDGSITYRAGARLSATLDIGRDVQASANVGAQYQIQQNYGLGIDYELGSAITLGTGVTYNQRDYRGSFVTIDERRSRIQDKISRVYGTVRYSAVKLYSLGLELAYQNRDSNPDQFSYDSFSALLTLRLHLGRES